MERFPQTLKTWRAARRFSQLDLAIEAQVSARHISFLETGRARPSRDMIGRLGDALQMPLDARNQMLVHAGFAPQYPGRAWDDADMAPIRTAVTLTLDKHMPNPGLALDRLWNVVQMNRAAQSLFGHLGVAPGDSLLDLMLSDTLPPLVENWTEVAYHAARRLRTESAAQGGVAKLDRAAEYLAQAGAAATPTSTPVIPTILKIGEMRLSLFATIAQFGTPGDIAIDDLKIELYFPLDAQAEDLLRRFAAS